MQMFHYIDTEQWDAIISSTDLNYNNYLHLNCLNLALSHKGVMQTDLFKYPQSGIQSLVSKYQACLRSHVCPLQLTLQSLATLRSLLLLLHHTFGLLVEP